ncbi:hypothetical protein ACWDUG_33350, partial [Streptomyces cellulosae]
WVNAEGKGSGGVELQAEERLAGEEGKIRSAQSGARWRAGPARRTVLTGAETDGYRPSTNC